MHLGEICLLTHDVPRLAAFYRALLQKPADSQDEGFQAILSDEPMLTILRSEDLHGGQKACIAFTVEDIQQEYLRLKSLSLCIVQPPKQQPWGAVNMILQDPDGNQVYLRQLPKAKE